MDSVKEPTAESPSGESKARTPAYAAFDSSTNKILHLLKFISHGLHGFRDELETKLAPEALRIVKEFAQRATGQDEQPSNQQTEAGTPDAVQDLSNARKSAEIDDLIQRLSETLLKPSNQFTGGFLAAREWIPVLLVTTVEAYLEDVLIYAATADSTIMKSSRLTVPCAEVVRARSLEELKKILPSRWSKTFLRDGGPDRWIKKLTKMGAREYGPETAMKMEALWGVRHLIIHSRGVATPEFVHRHPEIGAKIDANILIRNYQLLDWIKVVYHFVDVTDYYFVQRYAGTVSLT